MLLVLTLAGCESSPPQRGTDDGTVHRYHMDGKVTRRDETRHVVSIEHGPILDEKGKVWMAAMTMEYPVPRPDDFAKLQIGRNVAATVCSRQSDLEYWLERVEGFRGPE